MPAVPPVILQAYELIVPPPAFKLMFGLFPKLFGSYNADEEFSHPA